MLFVSIHLRSRGMNAPNRHAARAAARQWVKKQESAGIDSTR